MEYGINIGFIGKIIGLRKAAEIDGIIQSDCPLYMGAITILAVKKARGYKHSFTASGF